MCTCVFVYFCIRFVFGFVLLGGGGVLGGFFFFFLGGGIWLFWFVGIFWRGRFSLC